MGAKANDLRWMTNHMKSKMEPGILRMGCMKRIGRNKRDLYPSQLNPLCNERYKATTEIRENAG